MIAPRKRTVEEILQRYHESSRQLAEPIFTQHQKELFEQGVKEFEEGLYYEAHESWEHCWRAMRNGEIDDAEIILRGLVQLAAGFHCISQKRWKDALGNFNKAKPKIELATHKFLNINFSFLTHFLISKVHDIDSITKLGIDEKIQLILTDSTNGVRQPYKRGATEKPNE